MKSRKYTRRGRSFSVNEPAVAFFSGQPVSVFSLLGIEASSVKEPLNRVLAFRKGFKKSSFDRLKEVTGLDNETLATAMAVSSKTIQRAEVFDPVQSEKMFALAELYALGIGYFGLDGFRRWMERPLFSLGNIKPLELIDVSEGVAILKTEILRMQHGVAV